MNARQGECRPEHGQDQDHHGERCVSHTLQAVPMLRRRHHGRIGVLPGNQAHPHIADVVEQEVDAAGIAAVQGLGKLGHHQVANHRAIKRGPGDQYQQGRQHAPHGRIEPVVHRQRMQVAQLAVDQPERAPPPHLIGRQAQEEQNRNQNELIHGAIPQAEGGGFKPAP
jgi:hypothetical protein